MNNVHIHAIIGTLIIFLINILKLNSSFLFGTNLLFSSNFL